MKNTLNILLVALGAALLASCVEMQVDPAVRERPICFNVEQSKSADIVDFDGSEFRTFAYYLPTGSWLDIPNDRTWPAASQSYIEQGTVRQTTLDGQEVWKTTEQDYFWPKSGTLTFFSYRPMPGLTYGENLTLTGRGYQVSDWDVRTNQGDIQIADVICDQKDNNTGDIYKIDGVRTIFRHKLSKVRFTVTKSPKVTITGITLSNVVPKASYIQALRSDTETYRQWTANSDARETMNIGIIGKSYMVIPQKLEGSVLTITFTETITDGDVTTTSSYTATVDIADTWELGYQYLYNLSLTTDRDLDVMLTVARWIDVHSSIVL